MDPGIDAAAVVRAVVAGYDSSAVVVEEVGFWFVVCMSVSLPLACQTIDFTHMYVHVQTHKQGAYVPSEEGQDDEEEDENEEVEDAGGAEAEGARHDEEAE